MREYKTKKGYAILLYILCPFAIGLCLFTISFLIGSKNPETFWIGFFTSVILGLLAVVFAVRLLETIRGRLVIANDNLFSVSAFSTRQLMCNEIKGYRVVPGRYLLIESNNTQKKNIKVSIHFSKLNEIKEWLSENYSNLDIADAYQQEEEIIKETKKILGNEEFGRNPEQREAKLIKARRTADVLTFIGVSIGIWALWFPSFLYEFIIHASIAFPIVCAIALNYFKGLIKIDKSEDSAYPTLWVPLITICIGLFFRGVADYHIFDHSKIWTPSIMITVTYIVILALGANAFKFTKAKNYLTILGFSIYMFGYSYGAVVALNCLYDNSEPETFDATILSKRMSSKIPKKYYLELAPWGQQKEIDEVSVSKDLYNKLDQNDTVSVYFMKGKFDIPWFEITE